MLNKKNQSAMSIGEIFDKGIKRKKPPAYRWQDLALSIIKDLNIPNFKRNAVFKVCRDNTEMKVRQALIDTKELCQTGDKWKYFFKVIAPAKKDSGE
ncbi:hypothetical protein K8R32_00530 [bacterium]|nr:hypothetical protein [bacterium]